jgi:NAD(P)H-flavin reductase
LKQAVGEGQINSALRIDGDSRRVRISNIVPDSSFYMEAGQYVVFQIRSVINPMSSEPSDSFKIEIAVDAVN